MSIPTGIGCPGTPPQSHRIPVQIVLVDDYVTLVLKGGKKARKRSRSEGNDFSGTPPHTHRIPVQIVFVAMTLVKIKINLQRQGTGFSMYHPKCTEHQSRSSLWTTTRPWCIPKKKNSRDKVCESQGVGRWFVENSERSRNPCVNMGLVYRLVYRLGEVRGWGRDPFSRNFMKPTPRRKWYLTTGRRFH